MRTTRASLLLRLKDHSDAQAWEEFYAVYSPLLYQYARARGLSREDSQEVRDQCLEVVVRKIGTFQYDRKKGGFKSWLRRVTANKVVDLLRKRHERPARSGQLRALADPGPSPDQLWEQEWKRCHLKLCVEQVRSSVSGAYFKAFCLLLFDGCSVQDVCERLGMSADQVYLAKSRVLKRVRQKMQELGLDE